MTEPMIKRIERADGPRWQVYGRKDKRKVYVGSYETEKKAKTEERSFQVRQEMRATGELAPEHDDRKNLTEAVDLWLKMLKAKKSRSHSTYAAHMKLYVLPEIGPQRIAALTKASINAWLEHHSSRNAPTTCNGSLTALGAAFAWFISRDWLTVNPCHGVKRLVVSDRHYEWIKTREEITKLLSQCNENIRDLIAFALGTGARKDELLHLQWCDIDLERRLITIHRGRKGTTKSGKARHVPILDVLLPVIRAMHLKRAGAVLVFPNDKGKPKSKVAVHIPFKAAVDRAGLPIGLRFHDLRHTFASHWVIAQGDIFRLSKILGHKDVKVTQRTYAHLAPDAWEQDYHRVSFTVPSEARKATRLFAVRGDTGETRA